MAKLFIHIDSNNPNISIIEYAVNIIRSGGILVYPTDTVYGLGSDALNPEAVRRIFKIKVRPNYQPLPVIVSGLEMAKRLAFVDDQAEKLMNIFWPGALTIVLMKRLQELSTVVGGGLTVGLRMPNHSVSLILLRKSDLPLVATSANKHGKLSPFEACEALRQIGSEADLFLDAGRVGGQPSTIIDLTQKTPLIIRNGPVTREMIEKVIGPIG